MVGAGHKPANVRKVQILRDEKAAGYLCRLPDMGVILSSQALLWNGIGLMSLLAENMGESEWKILVELDPH